MNDESPIRINKLGYQVLGVIARDPTTGYDVAKALEKFRPVQVSQIYPLLSEFEGAGLLVSEEVVQAGKPNKKVYHPTPLARRVLRNWIATPTEDPVLRDDFLAKFYSLWQVEPGRRADLLRERLTWIAAETVYFTTRLEDLAADGGDKVDDPDCWQFCRNALMRRRLLLYAEETAWCRAVLDRLDGGADAATPGPGDAA